MTLEALKQRVADGVRDAIRLRTTGIPVWGIDEDGNSRRVMSIQKVRGVGIVLVKEDVTKMDLDDQHSREGVVSARLRTR